MVFSTKSFHLLLMNDNNSAAEFKLSLYSGQAGLTNDNVFATLSTIHACNEFRDDLTCSPLLVSQTIVLYTTGA